MLDTFKEASRDFFTRARTTTGDTYDRVYDFIFGVNVGDEVELHSLRSSKSKFQSLKFGKEYHLAPSNYYDDEDSHDHIDCSRNLVITSSTLFRKGPIPIEFLSHQEQNRLSRRGCLKEWDDSNQATSDNHLSFESPSSKSLLSYFARLGTGEDDTDIVNLAFVESLLNANASFNYPDVYGQSIFFAVVRDWHIDVANFAIERGADINHKDKYGRTPLHLAAAVNYAEMVDFLLMNGADISGKTHGEEQTPLHYAARYDSVEAMKVLIQGGAMIDSVDFIQRTPLQVAAEIGSHESVKFLLKLGAPVGVYDIYGNSTMFMMVEKMPKFAYEGLNQFFVEDNAMRRRYYYLDHLEYDVRGRSISKDARNVLQGIVMYKELDLIMHPAIQKLLDVKWKLFGKQYAIISNLLNIFYTLLATVLVFSFPYHPYDKQFWPVREKVWKIVLAALFFILTFYFWIKQIVFVKRSSSRDSSYKEHRLKCIRKQYPYCHPTWEEERDYFDEEALRIQRQKSAFWQDPWNIFEWVSLFIVLITFALHIANVLKPEKDVFKAAKLISAVSLILIWFRLYKTLRVFSMFAELTVLLGHVVSETLKFFLLFMDFFIPYVFFFFMLFGHHNDESNLTKPKDRDSNEFTSIIDTAYHVWILTIKASYPRKSMNDVNIYIAELAAGSYFAIMAVLFLFIYIGRLSEVFCRLHRKASANASLLIATLIINEEYELTMGQTKKQRRYMRHNCGPMVVPFEGSKEVGDEKQNINIGIDHVTTKVDEITNFLGKSSFPREDKQSYHIDQLSVLYTDIEKLAKKQSEIEYEMENSHSKIFNTQKKTLDMIKEAIDRRSHKNAPKRRRQAKKSGYETE